jgi:hypothetical protein
MLEFIGLSTDRLLVHRHVYAKEVFFPTEGACQDPVFNTWQILTMRKLFLSKLGITGNDVPLVPLGLLSSSSSKSGSGSDGSGVVAAKGSSEPVGRAPFSTGNLGTGNLGRNATTTTTTAVSGDKPVMMLLKRSAGTKHTRNGHDLVRQWSDAFANTIIVSLQQAFPHYNVVLFSDRNETLMTCYRCQIEAFARAAVLIGVHGAGLGNMVYMKPNSAVVELAPYPNDGRCLLGGGPFSRTAALLSHNYMMHMPPYEEFKWISKGSSSEFNVTRFVLHIHSFLASIDFL